SERRAQLMADVGEDAALGGVQFHQLLIALLQHLLVLVQLVTEGELTEAQAVVKQTPDHDENAGHKQEIEVVEKGPKIPQVNPVAQEVMEQGDGNVHAEHFEKDNEAFLETPAQQDG